MVQSPLNQLPSIGTLAIFNIVGQRLVVSIRKVQARQQNLPSTTRLEEVLGDINFSITEGDKTEPSNYGRPQEWELASLPIRPPTNVASELECIQYELR